MYKYTISIRLFILFILFQYNISEECLNTCGKPEKLSFCSHIDFTTCQTLNSWEEQENNAFMMLKNIILNTNKTVNESNNILSNNNNNTINYELNLNDYKNNTNILSNVLSNSTIIHSYLLNQTDICYLSLKKILCAIEFPICEIGSDSNRLCENSCNKTIKKYCPKLNGLCDLIDKKKFEKAGKCFDIDYAGPQVGMWVAGFTISLVFSILNSIGINLQKYSLTKNEKATIKKTSFQQPLWALGFTLICLGSILDFIAFGMAPQTLLAPLAALSLVWNMFIAPIFHKEKVTKRNIIATIIIFIGVTLTVIFAGHSTPSYELEDLLRLYKRPGMTIYMIFVFLFLTLLIVGTRIIEKKHIYEGGLIHIICYGGTAGTFGGQSVLLAKSTVELLKSSLWGEETDTFLHIETYIIIIAMAICLVFQITYLNGGLKLFDALVMVPVYQSFWILMSVLGGIMYFEEYTSMTSTQKLMFTIGGIITIYGIIYLLQDRRNNNNNNNTNLNVKYEELAAFNDIDDENPENGMDQEEDEDTFYGSRVQNNNKNNNKPSNTNTNTNINRKKNIK